MNYLYNNDLVGKNKPWGPVSSLTPLQFTIYGRYKDMCYRCTRPQNNAYKHYGAKGIENHFTSLSHYYHTLKSSPLWSQFKANPEAFDIDKDIKCGHGAPYDPRTIIIIPYGINRADALVRTRSRAIELDGVVYSSASEAERQVGMSPGTLGHHLHQSPTNNTHFNSTWVDNKGVQHSVKFV